MAEALALRGGTPVYSGGWPSWPIQRQEARDALLGAFESGRWTISAPGGGEHEPALGRAFAQHCGAAVGVPTSSGSAALAIALAGAGVGAGDEVLVPAISWVACAAVVLSLGAVPVPVDVDPHDLCMSPSAAEGACTARTAAILLVHQNCWIADVDRFADLARSRGLALVEDGSHAHGARRHGRRVGTFGVTAGFSLQQSKLLACGEGGVAVATDARAEARLQQLRANGREYDPVTGSLVEAQGVMGDNHVMAEMPAAIALANLAHLDEENRTRASAAAHLTSELEAIEGVVPPRHPDDDEPGFHKYTLALDLAAFADLPVALVARAVSAEIGVRCEVLDAPLGRNPLYEPASSPRFKGRGDLLRPSVEDHPVAAAAVGRCLAFRHHLLLAGTPALDAIVESVARVQRHAPALRDVAPDAIAAR